MNNKKIIAFMSGKKAVGREEMIMRFGADYSIPSYEKLIGSYIASKIAQALASARDEEGRRLFLAKLNCNKIEYVNIENCTDISSLGHIRNRIANNILGQEASLEKVDMRLKNILRSGGDDRSGGTDRSGGDAA